VKKKFAEQAGEHVADGGDGEDEAEVRETEECHAGEQPPDLHENAAGHERVKDRGDIVERIERKLGGQTSNAVSEEEIADRLQGNNERQKTKSAGGVKAFIRVSGSGGGANRFTVSDKELRTPSCGGAVKMGTQLR